MEYCTCVFCLCLPANVPDADVMKFVETETKIATVKEPALKQGHWLQNIDAAIISYSLMGHCK